MVSLSTTGALVRITPSEELQYWPGPGFDWEFLDDKTPFTFQVAGWLEDGHINYGLHGPVVDGPERYRGLICSIITRVDGSDWRVESSSAANFRVGPNLVVRDHRYDFRHPDGTTLEGYPIISRFGDVEVLNQ